LHVSKHSTRNKSLFASLSSEKEEFSFFEKKEAKKLLFFVRINSRGVFLSPAAIGRLGLRGSYHVCFLLSCSTLPKTVS
jgi:hypothetical protein